MRRRYALAALAVLLLEIGIALWVSDSIVRPFVGDALVVVLLYCLSQTAVPRAPRRAALEVVAFAFLIEGMQAVDYAAWLGADRHPWLSVVLGRTFSWGDFLAYAAGAALAALDPSWAAEPRNQPSGETGIDPS